MRKSGARNSPRYNYDRRYYDGGEYSRGYDKREYSRGYDRRGYSRQPRYEQSYPQRGYPEYSQPYRQDDYDDFTDSKTGRLVAKMTKEKKPKEKKKPKQKTVTCNNVKYDTCCKQGVYKNIRTGELRQC